MRKLISDFAIIMAILLFCGVDALVGVDTPKLIVPSQFKVAAVAPAAHTREVPSRAPPFFSFFTLVDF